VGHQVDALGGSADEDQLVRFRDAQALLEVGPGPIVGIRRLATEVVYAAVNIGVLVGEKARQGLDDAARLLGRGAVVEIDERIAINLARENGEIGAERRRIEGRHFPRGYPRNAREQRAAAGACPAR
jgi:hypothetical protein